MSEPVGNDGAVVYRERWEVVTEEIRRRIVTGEMLPGSRIRETELAEGFGVSRGPVREALRILEVAGLVLRVPRHGSYVAPVRRRDVDELYTLRASIEELAVRRALRRADAGLAAQLGRAVERLEMALTTEAPFEVVESDIDFHSTFYRHADHDRLVAVWATLADPLRILMRLSSRRSDPDWSTTVGGHLLIASAAREGDEDACVEATLDHLEHARSLVLSFVEQQEIPER
ncbi:MAG TPA: hypothetical protein DCQ36_07125 [Actinobacteria bacterium]|nr:hypothetical protein [Actinomycetota bacterium]